MASEKVHNTNAVETVLYRPGELVTECMYSNVYVLEGGVLKTHPAGNLILGGIARAHLPCVCEALSAPIDEAVFMLLKLFTADEAIAISSSNLCIRTNRIDGKVVGDKALGLFECLCRYLLDECVIATT